MYKVLVLTLVTLVITSGCNTRGGAPEVSGPAAAVQTTSHKSFGKITNLKPAVPSVEIDHEDIPGLMPAMEMEFHVKDKSLLNGLQTGDRVEFTVENGVRGIQVTAIRKQ